MNDTSNRQKHFQDRLRSTMKARRITGEAMAELVGAHPVTISKLLNGKMALDDEWRDKFANALDLTSEELFGDGPIQSPQRPQTDVRTADIKLPPVVAMPNDVPVYGTAAGSHVGGAFHLDLHSVIDWVRRPPALMGAVNAYSLYIEGTSMVPEHNPGDLRFIHPDRPPRIGDSVVVQVRNDEEGGMEATIGHLIRRTEKNVVIGKLNPEATIEIKRESVIAIHKVLTMNDLFGV